jgi:hypothetical protein
VVSAVDLLVHLVGDTEELAPPLPLPTVHAHAPTTHMRRPASVSARARTNNTAAALTS